MKVPWKDLALALDELLEDVNVGDLPGEIPLAEWKRHKETLDEAWMRDWGGMVCEGNDRTTGK